VPVSLVAFDLLEHRGEDVRPLPLRDRRARLANLVAAQGWDGRLVLSPAAPGASIRRSKCRCPTRPAAASLFNSTARACR